MTDDQISALVTAWLVSLAAMTLLFLALAIAPFWNAAIYLAGLSDAIMMDHF